ncbi:MAG: AAA family ATPase, partial [Gammaproteobacteria bacterium]|nr:AAA family ATPase [Gammaproteobacteria bacterium]
ILLQHFFEYMAQQHGIPLPQLDKMAANCLNQYTWPGNVRELRNLCERLVILLQGQTVFVENLPHEIRQASGINNTVKGFLLPEQGLNLEQLEQNMIIQALDKTSGNRSRAARLLGLTRDTLLYRMKKYAMR